MNKSELAEKIRILRKAKGLKQDDLSAKAGVSIRVIKDLEAASGNPTMDSLSLVLSALGVSISDLYGSNKEPRKIMDSDRSSLILEIQNRLNRLDLEQLTHVSDSLDQIEALNSKNIKSKKI